MDARKASKYFAHYLCSCLYYITAVDKLDIVSFSHYDLVKCAFGEDQLWLQITANEWPDLKSEEEIKGIQKYFAHWKERNVSINISHVRRIHKSHMLLGSINCLNNFSSNHISQMQSAGIIIVLTVQTCWDHTPLTIPHFFFPNYEQKHTLNINGWSKGFIYYNQFP